jgi:hypothetical protein
MRRQATQNSVGLLALAAMVIALLVNAAILPDPCLAYGDSCNPKTHASDACGTLCCSGFIATPETPVILRTSTTCEESCPAAAAAPEAVTLEPLIRPPIPA